MTDTGPDDLEVRLQWSDQGEPGAGPVDLAWDRPVAGDDAGPVAGTVRRGVRLRPGESRSTSALRAEVDELRAEVERLRGEVHELRSGLERRDLSGGG